MCRPNRSLIQSVNFASLITPHPHQGEPVLKNLTTMLLNDEGQGLVEYALIIALVSILAIAALQVLGKKASNTLSNAAGYLS